MQGYGTIDDPENDPGSLNDIILNDSNGDWSEIGDVNNWTTSCTVFFLSHQILSNMLIPEIKGSAEIC